MTFVISSQWLPHNGPASCAAAQRIVVNGGSTGQQTSDAESLNASRCSDREDLPVMDYDDEAKTSSKGMELPGPICPAMGMPVVP